MANVFWQDRIDGTISPHSPVGKLIAVAVDAKATGIVPRWRSHQTDVFDLRDRCPDLRVPRGWEWRVQRGEVTSGFMVCEKVKVD
jgi:hypothetical protein